MPWIETDIGKISNEFNKEVEHIINERGKYLKALSTEDKAVREINRDEYAKKVKATDADRLKISSQGLKYLREDSEFQGKLEGLHNAGNDDGPIEAVATLLQMQSSQEKMVKSAKEVHETLLKAHAKYAVLVEKLVSARDALKTLDGMLDLPAPAPKAEKCSFMSEKAAKEAEGRKMFDELKSQLNDEAIDKIVEGSDVKNLPELKKALTDAADYPTLVDAEYDIRIAVALAKENFTFAAELKKEKEAKIAKYKTEITDAIATLISKAPSAWGDGVKKPAHEKDIAKANEEKAAKEKEANQQYEALKAQLTPEAMDKMVEGSDVKNLPDLKKALTDATDYPSLIEAEAALRIAVALAKEDYEAAAKLKAEKETKLAEFKSAFIDAIASLEAQIKDWETQDAAEVLAAAVKESEPAPAPAAGADEPAKPTFDSEQIDRVNEALSGYRTNPLFASNAKDIEHAAAHKHGKGDYVVAKGSKTVEHVKAVTLKALAALENLEHLPSPNPDAVILKAKHDSGTSNPDLKAWYESRLNATTWSDDLFGSPDQEGFDSLSFNIGLMQMVDQMGQELFGLIGLRNSEKYHGDVKYDLE